MQFIKKLLKIAKMKISKKYQFIKDKNMKILFVKRIRLTDNNYKILKTNTMTKLDSSYKLNDQLSKKEILPDKIAHLPGKLEQPIRGGIEGISDIECQHEIDYIYFVNIV